MKLNLSAKTVKSTSQILKQYKVTETDILKLADQPAQPLYFAIENALFAKKAVAITNKSILSLKLNGKMNKVKSVSETPLIKMDFQKYKWGLNDETVTFIWKGPESDVSLKLNTWRDPFTDKLEDKFRYRENEISQLAHELVEIIKAVQQQTDIKNNDEWDEKILQPLKKNDQDLDKEEFILSGFEASFIKQVTMQHVDKMLVSEEICNAVFNMVRHIALSEGDLENGLEAMKILDSIWYKIIKKLFGALQKISGKTLKMKDNKISEINILFTSLSKIYFAREYARLAFFSENEILKKWNPAMIAPRTIIGGDGSNSISWPAEEEYQKEVDSLAP